MKVAIVGPRRGADKAAVEQFVSSLHAKYPDAIVVSGGAEGVDSWAETAWLALGGTVWSYRVRKKADDHFVTVKWEIGSGHSQMYELVGEPSWADWKSALLYRSMLVAEVADQVCAFAGRSRMRGTEFTTWVSRQGYDKPTWLWADGDWQELP